MTTMIVVFVVAASVVGLMMAGLGLKMLLHKEKEFKRPCTNADPTTGRCAHCTCDAKTVAARLAAASSAQDQPYKQRQEQK